MARRTSRTLLALAGAIAGSALAPLGADASPVPGGPNQLEPGENITAVHNIDFIATFGTGGLGDEVRIDVLRAGHPIATARGPLVDTPEGPGLEANHGPLGTPQPGDCWDSFTADIRPQDVVRVTNIATGDMDEAVVDEITFDSAEVVGDEAHFVGTAKFADGTPIPAADLNSGFWRTDVGGADSRGENPFVQTDGLGGYTARWQPPTFGTFRGNVPTPLQVANAARQEFGYGHVAPLPAETQIVDGVGEAPGPALGCEASPIPPANAVTVLSAPGVNLAGGDLTASGIATNDATSVQVEIDDEDPTTAPVSATTVDAPDGGSGGGPKAWSATFARADLDALADGTLTITATFNGTGPATATRTLPKDLAAPAVPTASPAPGTYEGELFVDLSAEPGTVIRYSLDGGTTRLFGPAIRVGEGSHTITATATDAAGNVSAPASLAYTILPAAAQQAGDGSGGGGAAGGAAGGSAGTQSDGGGQAGGGQAGGTATDPVFRVFGLRVAPRTRLATARRRGIRAVFIAPQGGLVARVELFRAGSRRPVGFSSVRLRRGGRHAVTLRSSRALRRLRPGLYRLVVRVGPSRDQLGRGVVRRVRILR